MYDFWIKISKKHTKKNVIYFVDLCRLLTLSPIFLRMFESREISNLNQDRDHVRASPINDSFIILKPRTHQRLFYVFH